MSDKPKQKPRPKRKKKNNHAFAKTMIVIASILSTFLGGEFLANQQKINQQTTAITQQPENESTVSNLVQLIIPEPLTRSQSSR